MVSYYKNISKPALSQYADHVCEIVVKSDFKLWPDTILLLGHIVTLNINVGTEILRATRLLNMVIISLKKF